MKLTVFGATGPTGEEILRQALGNGHRVTAVARNPAAVTLKDARLRALAGDVVGDRSLAPAIAEADAVLSALGAREMRGPTTVYSAGTKAIVEAMDQAGVTRLVCVTADPVGPSHQMDMLSRRLVHPILRRFFGGGYDDMKRMEKMLLVSSIDWTIYRPPRLTSGGYTGRYRTSIDGRVPRPWSITYADLAAAMLAAVENPDLKRVIDLLRRSGRVTGTKTLMVLGTSSRAPQM